MQCSESATFPRYEKFDAYMKISKTFGALKLIKEYDRLAEIMYEMRELDFGNLESWTVTDKGYYKGCNPQKNGKNPVVCDR